MVPWVGVHVPDEGFLTVTCFIIDPQVWVPRGFKEAWKQSLREAKRQEPLPRACPLWLGATCCES